MSDKKKSVHEQWMEMSPMEFVENINRTLEAEVKKANRQLAKLVDNTPNAARLTKALRVGVGKQKGKSNE